MVLVLFLLGIIVLFIFILIILSSIKIHFKNINVKFGLNKKFSYKGEIHVGLYLLDRVPLIKICINKKKTKKLKVLERIKKYRQNKNFNLNLKIIKTIIKTLSPKMEELDLDIKISIEDALYTALITAFASSSISIFLPYIFENNKYKKAKYNVKPEYSGKNQAIINLNSIIKVKMVHIISVIYIVLIKRSDNKNGRTSNRRAYAHSYE